MQLLDLSNISIQYLTPLDSAWLYYTATWLYLTGMTLYLTCMALLYCIVHVTWLYLLYCIVTWL